ncbi:MAG: nitrous oxide-stimulated promoter family protein [Thermoanaerobaculales bacterium]
MSRSGFNRVERERRTVGAMIRIYCKAHHPDAPPPCAECAEIEAYASCRLDRCPYGADKPACTNCPIHCYRPDFREKVREVMRFSGPRMAARHPILALRHLIDERKQPPPLRNLRHGEGE